MFNFKNFIIAVIVVGCAAIIICTIYHIAYNQGYAQGQIDELHKFIIQHSKV